MIERKPYLITKAGPEHKQTWTQTIRGKVVTAHRRKSLPSAEPKNWEERKQAKGPRQPTHSVEVYMKNGEKFHSDWMTKEEAQKWIKKYMKEDDVYVVNKKTEGNHFEEDRSFKKSNNDTTDKWERINKADTATATMPRGHKAYNRTVEGKQQQIRQKGEVIKDREEEKPESATVLGASHKEFTALLDSYFHNQQEMKMMMNLIDTHKTEMEAAMSQIRPMLSKFENLEKAEEKFRTEFKEGDWNYKFLSFTKETKPYKDLYTKAFNMLNDIQQSELKKAEQALSKITGQEKFERTKSSVAKSQEFKDLVKSYIGRPETEETMAQFRLDVLSLILLKAAKAATSDDEAYERDKAKDTKKPLPKDKDKKPKPKPKEEEPEEEEEPGEAQQQLLEALTNLISAKEAGVDLLQDFFSRKKESSPKKEDDKKSDKKPDKDKKETKKSLVEIVTPIIQKRIIDEVQKAQHQAQLEEFEGAFTNWAKAIGAKPVFRTGKPKIGKQAKKDQKQREQEDKEMAKARSHK